MGSLRFDSLVLAMCLPTLPWPQKNGNPLRLAGSLDCFAPLLLTCQNPCIDNGLCLSCFCGGNGCTLWPVMVKVRKRSNLAQRQAGGGAPTGKQCSLCRILKKIRLKSTKLLLFLFPQVQSSGSFLGIYPRYTRSIQVDRRVTEEQTFKLPTMRMDNRWVEDAEWVFDVGDLRQVGGFGGTFRFAGTNIRLNVVNF